MSVRQRVPKRDIGEVREELTMLMHMERAQNSCPPGLRNFLIALLNLAVIVFIIVVLNEIYYAHEKDTKDYCDAGEL